MVWYVLQGVEEAFDRDGAAGSRAGGAGGEPWAVARLEAGGSVGVEKGVRRGSQAVRCPPGWWRAFLASMLEAWR
jgi:hypothetical protein